MPRPPSSTGPRASDVQGQFRLLLSPSKQADGATIPGLLMPGSTGLGGTVMMQAQIWCGSSWVRSRVGRDGTLLIDPSPRRLPQEMRRRSPTSGTVVVGAVPYVVRMYRTSIVMKHRILHQRGWPGVAVIVHGRLHPEVIRQLQVLKIQTFPALGFTVLSVATRTCVLWPGATAQTSRPSGLGCKVRVEYELQYLTR